MCRRNAMAPRIPNAMHATYILPAPPLHDIMKYICEAYAWWWNYHQISPMLEFGPSLLTK